MNELIEYQTALTPWYHFWNPESGLFGGMLFGFIMVATVVILMYLIDKGINK